MKQKITDRREVIAGTNDLDWEGIWDSKSFVKMLDEAFKKANDDYHKILTRYDFFFEKEYDYSDEYSHRLKMRLYRMETDQEVEHRVHWEKRREEENKKQQAREKERQRKAKEKAEAKENDPEYKKYLELQRSLRKKKIL